MPNDHPTFTLDQLAELLDDVLHDAGPELGEFAVEVLRRKIFEARVLVAKQNDYGPHNIGRPPSGISPEVALIVRINDKLQRAGNLTAGAGKQATNEPLTDTGLDIANYGTIFGMVVEGVWPTQ